MEGEATLIDKSTAFYEPQQKIMTVIMFWVNTEDNIFVAYIVDKKEIDINDRFHVKLEEDRLQIDNYVSTYPDYQLIGNLGEDFLHVIKANLSQ